MGVIEPPRVLLVHNGYQQRGGEDAVVDAELALLRGAGHAVEVYRRANDEIAAMPRTRLLADTLWSRRTGAEVDAIVARFRPDVVHVHNTHPLISPSLHWAAARARVPVVQTLHNFRLLCPQGMLLRDQRVCEDCVGHLAWRGVVHRCYRDSAVQTGVIAATVSLHRAIGTWRHKVRRYIALNAFCRDVFVRGGLPPERVVVKPNFVDVAPTPEVARERGLFVGRLSVEKGVGVLAQALAGRPGRDADAAATSSASATRGRYCRRRRMRTSSVSCRSSGSSTACAAPAGWCCPASGTRTSRARWSRPMPADCR
jgi:glycosyltransferase involved in cell wall biosynthesis